jgi:hypothetical protein
MAQDSLPSLLLALTCVSSAALAHLRMNHFESLKWFLSTVNRLSLEHMCYLWRKEKDTIVSPDISKAPFVQRLKKRQIV